MKRYVISDIHGSYKALMQCLVRSSFNYKKDLLICLGDTCDGWPDTRECFDELLKIPNLIYILGNHDDWLLDYVINSKESSDWLRQGGIATLQSYNNAVTKEHVVLLNNSRLFYELDNMLFVHAGIKTFTTPHKLDKETLLWDRNLVEYAYQSRNIKTNLTKYKKIFVGHTPTIKEDLRSNIPLKFCEVIMIDTGAGHGGFLTIMNIDTEEYFQSDLVGKLYPDSFGR